MTNYLNTPGQLFPQERHFLRSLAESAVETFDTDAIIVNIGVRQGASLHCLRAGAPEARLIGVDINLHQKNKTLAGNPGAVLIEGDSNDPLTLFLMPNVIHLLFVDGGHSEDVVGGDIHNLTPRVCAGGVAAFHDYHEKRLRSGFGVKAAIDRWMREPGWSSRWELHKSCRLTISFRRINDTSA